MTRAIRAASAIWPRLPPLPAKSDRIDLSDEVRFVIAVPPQSGVRESESSGARLDAERVQRRRDRIGRDLAHRNNSAFAPAVGTEVIDWRRVRVRHIGPDGRQVARGGQEIVREESVSGGQRWYGNQSVAIAAQLIPFAIGSRLSFASHKAASRWSNKLV